MGAACSDTAYIDKPLKPEGAACACAGASYSLKAAAMAGCLQCATKFARNAGQLVDGTTALIQAAMHGWADIVELLVPREAGMKDSNKKTAAVLAAEGYHLTCLGHLLRSETERKASGATLAMLSAYRGDIRDLLRRQGEWQKKCINLTAFDFALFGGQRRAMQLLTRTGKLREFFAQEAIPKGTDDTAKLARFLSCHGQFVRDFLPLICAAASSSRSGLFALSLGKRDGVSRHLRSVSTPEAGLAMRRIRECNDKAEAIDVLTGLKHVGFSSDGKTVMDLATRQDSPIRTYLNANPLKKRQMAHASKEAERQTPETKQAAWREVEAESAFNRSVIQEARNARHKKIAVRRAVLPASAGALQESLPLITASIYATYHRLKMIVQAMLDE